MSESHISRIVKETNCLVANIKIQIYEYGNIQQAVQFLHKAKMRLCYASLFITFKEAQRVNGEDLEKSNNGTRTEKAQVTGVARSLKFALDGKELEVTLPQQQSFWNRCMI